MTRTRIHEGAVDVLCECGHPTLTHRPLAYGFRINITCIDCNVDVALDVIE